MNAKAEVYLLENEILAFLRCNSDCRYIFSEITRKLDFSDYRIADALSLLLFTNKINIQVNEDDKKSKAKRGHRTNSNLSSD
jgi:hypothetical protein